MEIEYFFKNARAEDILNFFDKHHKHPNIHEYQVLFVTLRELGELECCKVNGKPIQLNPDEVKI
jgi:hypothetical protein